MVSDLTKLYFIGSIPEAMLLNVPVHNLVVNEYQKKPGSGVHPMPEDLLKAINEAKNPNVRQSKRVRQVHQNLSQL